MPTISVSARTLQLEMCCSMLLLKMHCNIPLNMHCSIPLNMHYRCSAMCSFNQVTVAEHFRKYKTEVTATVHERGQNTEEVKSMKACFVWKVVSDFAKFNVDDHARACVRASARTCIRAHVRACVRACLRVCLSVCLSVWLSLASDSSETTEVIIIKPGTAWQLPQTWVCFTC